MNKSKFYLGSHEPVKEYGLLAQPLSKAPKVTTHGNYNLVDLNRENIGIDKDFQRSLNRTQISNIQSKWDDDNCDLPNVYIHKHNGKYFPQITDGQHRICASPHEVITCRTVNTLASITRCLEANDPRTKSSWEVNALFWARKAELDRLKGVDKENIKGLIKCFKRLGYNPLNPTKDQAVDLGGNIASLHKKMLNAINTRLRSRLLEDKERWAFTKKIMEDTVEIVDHVFNEEVKEEGRIKFGGQIWSGLPQFLLDSREKFGLGGVYDIEEIKNILKGGVWGISGYHARKEKLETFNDFSTAAKEYELKKVKGVSDRRADYWQRLFLDMYKLHNS